MADKTQTKPQTSQPQTPPHIAEQIAQLAREARVELYGPDGIPEWGTKFIDIEQQAIEVGNQVARTLIEQAVAGQAAQAPPDQALKIDGQPDAVPIAKTADAKVDTPVGHVDWQQPLARQENSSADFFPSGQSTRA